jgi:hypothetical protein
MKTYQIVFRIGLTRNIEADAYEKHGSKIIFLLDGNPALYLDQETVISVEEFVAQVDQVNIRACS